jgi:pentatricopeptide repeat protein
MIEGYKFIRTLGSGGFGTVVLAEEEVSGKKVAIKKLYRNLLANDDLILNEIKTISRFNHPNIVQYYFARKQDDVLIFVMEYCEGGSLGDAINKKRFTFELAIDTVLQISKTLVLINGMGINHNDIKPWNLLFGENDVVKISDFGVANTNTRTIKYMPPNKVFDNEPNYNYNSDIFALGITFIELLRNEFILTNLSDDERADKLISGDLGIMSFPIWLQEIIMKMLSLNPNYQFKDMSEIVTAIETRNIPFQIDKESLDAANYAQKLNGLLKRNKYYTIRLIIENIAPTFKNHTSILQVLGNYYLKINNYRLAKKIFIALKGKLPSVNINKELGIINLEADIIGVAIKHLTEYLLLYPDDCEAYNLLLECYYKAGRYDDGLELSDQLKKFYPKEICFKVNRDLFYFVKNDTAKEDVEAYNPYVPNNKITDYNKWIVLNRYRVLGNDNLLTDKLLFCHFSITKSPKKNLNYEIKIDGEKFMETDKSIIMIGRDGYDNDISFTDNNISRKNAILILLENENWIYELNGVDVYLDDTKIHYKKRLYYNHEIRIGKHILEIKVDKTKLF